MASILDRLRKPAPVDTQAGAEASGAPPVELDPPVEARKTSVFTTETAPLPDALEMAGQIRTLAEMASHAEAQTPLSIGIFGAAGTGKSYALSALLADVRGLAKAAAGLAQTPFLRRIATARVDAASSSDPASAIANALHTALHAPADMQAQFAGWAEAATLRSGDPQQAMRDESDRLADMRRRQDQEKQALEDIQNRRARLTENVLYDAAGTRIDTFARSNRASIESRLAGFGFSNPDAIATYKDLVRDYAENSGTMRRIRMFLHSLWAFDGQTKLIVLAIIFGALGWFFGQLQTPPAWLANFMTSTQESFSGFAAIPAWIKNNPGPIQTIKYAAYFAAAGAILLNIGRAFRFLAPISRGAKLLHADIDTRRRDLDNLIKTQSERVDDIGKDATAQAERLAEAQLRADAARSAPGAIVRSPFTAVENKTANRARAFLEAITSGLANGADNSAPQRIIVAIDNLDALPPAQALAFVQQAKSILNVPGMVLLIAIDPQHLKSGLEASGAIARIADDAGQPLRKELNDAIGRMVQMLIRIDAREGAEFGELVKSLLGKSSAATAAAPDAATSALDAPMRPGEPELLTALSDLAGTTPRQIKRFVNTYRLIRMEVPLFAPLVLALAVQSGALDAEMREFEAALEGVDDNQPVVPPQDVNSRIAFAIKAAATAQVTPLTAGSIREAQAIAARFSNKF